MGKNVRKAAVLGIAVVGIALGICFMAYGTEGTGEPVYPQVDMAEPGLTVAEEPATIQDGMAGDTGKPRGAAVVEPALPQWLREKVKEQEAAVTGEDPQQIPDSRFLVENRAENDMRVLSAAGQCMTGDGGDRVFYVIGRNYVPEGSALLVMFGRRLEYSCTREETFSRNGDRYCVVRFAVKEAAGGAGGGSDADGFVWTDETVPALRHWNVGDVVVRTLDGVGYRFRCIDRNYGEGRAGDNGGLALFLCESVIPADSGSRYAYERLADGSHGYVYYPGPVVNFGESSEYADSGIRAWLSGQEADPERFPAVNVGVETSCTGRTAPGSFSSCSPSQLRFSRLGSQLLTDRYFILSVEEALKYRDFLWNVDGCGEEETAANAGTFSAGFWLRTPMGNESGEDTGCVYVVDLVNGNIHPQAVKPEAEGATDEETAVTSPIGVRPAFVLRQKD